MDLPTFRTQFPEFKGVSDSVVSAWLAAAALEIDISLWGMKADQGQGLLTAHKLATSPFGQSARMVAKDGTTTYWFNYQKLVRQVSSGYRVT